jgi:F0F1-type ATP synthase assembly protein I
MTEILLWVIDGLLLLIVFLLFGVISCINNISCLIGQVEEAIKEPKNPYTEDGDIG